MILIIGGAYQGKAAFAESLFPKIRWQTGSRAIFRISMSARAFYDFMLISGGCWKKDRMWMILRKS